MPEVASAFLSTKKRDERADSPGETRDRPRGTLAEQRFEFADRVEVRRILRHVAERRTPALDRLYASDFEGLPNDSPRMRLSDAPGKAQKFRCWYRSPP
jgi:hypothetical protein